MDIDRGRRIPVDSPGCGVSGATTIERDLAAADGALGVPVTTAPESADADPTDTDPWGLARAIERSGYRAVRPVAA
jgi:hypothetical protein